MLSLLTLGLLAPIMLFEKKFAVVSRLSDRSKLKIYFGRWVKFINAPRVFTFYTAFLFVVYLILCSVTLLSYFNEKSVSLQEYASLVYTVLLVLSELVEFINYPTSPKFPIYKRFYHRILQYFRGNWNLFDVFIYSIFSVALIFRMSSLLTGQITNSSYGDYVTSR